MQSLGFGLIDRVRKMTKSLPFVRMILSTAITRTLRSFHLTDLRKFVDSLRWLPNMCLHSLSKSGSFTLHADKKNENKEVAVDDFLGAESAVKAIDHSM
jgi:hypothetical protein